jgi:hypothetical protein
MKYWKLNFSGYQGCSDCVSEKFIVFAGIYLCSDYINGEKERL